MQTRAVVNAIGAVVVIAAIGGGVWYLNSTAAASAQVGECLSGTDADSLAQADCGSPEATFKVVGRIEDQTEIAADLNGCSEFDTATTNYWQGSSGRGANATGTLLCLEPLG
jgi:hypothetical protein